LWVSPETVFAWIKEEFRTLDGKFEYDYEAIDVLERIK